MWIKSLAVSLTIIVMSLQSFAARKEAVFFGGGGEPAKDTTIFDQTFLSFMNNTQAGGWKTKTFFDGGHSMSDAIALDKTGGGNKQMTQDNLNKEIDELKKKIESGQLSKGDQLLIAIATHGALQDKESTHQVATIDGLFNLDRLKEVQKLAESKGVKLAIMDMSCYSGNTLKLGSDKTCVVSAASSANVGYNVTGTAFMDQIGKNKNMEQAFLDARQTPNMTNPDSPQISTSAGKAAGAATAALSENMISRKELSEALSKNSCEPLDKTRYAKLLAQLRDVDRVASGKPAVDPLETELTQAIADYNAKRTVAQDSFSLSEALNQKTCVQVQQRDLCYPLSKWEEMTNILKLGTGLSAQQKAIFAEAQKKALSTLEYSQYKEIRAAYDGKAQSLYTQAEAVAKVERKIYRKIYEKKSASSKAANPCKDFQL